MKIYQTRHGAGMSTSRSVISFIIFITCLLLAVVFSYAQNVTIPDANFESALLAHVPVVDLNDDGFIQVSEAEAFTGKLLLANQGITDLTGIQAFVNLTKLDVNQNTLTSLDISANTSLTWLNCYQNDLATIDVSNLTSLNFLHLADNNLTSLDVSLNTGLDTLITYTNPIGSLDVTANTELLWLLAFTNGLSSIDISNNPNLKYFGIGGNPISSLDLSANPLIETLSITVMPNMTSIDISNLTNLKTLFASGGFTSFDLTGLSKLESVSIGNSPSITSVTVSGNTNLKSFQVTGTQVSSIDLSGSPNLTSVSVFNNALTYLNIANGNNEAITSFNAVTNPGLGCISVDDIDYATTNFTNIPNGTTFEEDCLNPTIHFPDAKFLAGLVAHVPAIDTDGNGKIGEVEAAAFTGNLDLAGLQITSISGIEYFTGATGINLDGNPLIAADISENDIMTSFSCADCQLRVLDVANGNNSNFIDFDVTGNAYLTCVNVDNSSYSNSNWTNIPNGTGFSVDCIVNIPNAAFKTALTTHSPVIDLNDNGEIELSEAKAFTGHLNANNSAAITDVIGLEAFQNITILYLVNNDIQSVDVSQNTKVTEFWIFNNYDLPNLNVANMPDLGFLYASNLSLTSIDVSRNTKLTKLYTALNDLTSLDVSNNAKLEILSTGQNPLTSIDLSNNSKLKEVYLNQCNLYSLDVTSNSALTKLNVTTNSNLTCVQVTDVAYANANYTKSTNTAFNTNCPPPIPDANLRNALLNHNPVIDTNDDNQLQLEEMEAFTETLFLTSKGIANATGLENFVNITGLEIGNNNVLSNFDVTVFTDITSLDVTGVISGALDLSSNPNLETVYCGGSGLTSLNVTGNPNLVYLNVNYGSLTSLDLSANTLLTDLDLSDNEIASIDLSNNTFLENLNLDVNSISAIDLSANTALVTLYMSNTQGGLSTIDVSANENLEELRCSSNNQLTTLVFGNNPVLAEISGSQHAMESIDLSSLTALTYLNLSQGNLTSIDLSTNVNLTDLDLYGNQLTAMNLTANTKLENAYFDDNLLESVDLTGLTSLIEIYLNDNQLTAIDFSTNTALESVDIYNNYITEMDFSQNPMIIYVYASNNDLYAFNIANGNNELIDGLEVYDNLNLVCVTVDNVAYAESNFTDIDEGLQFSTGCGDYRTDILTFSLADQTGDATIDAENHTVEMEVYFSAGLTSLSPTMTLSSGASVSPSTDVSTDFTNSVNYTVTAENGVTEQVWNVTVTLAAPRTDTDILTFQLGQQTGAATINATNHTVAIAVANGTSLLVLAPMITTSPGATVSPESGAASDFTNPVVYTVTAEDGSTTQAWTVTVTEADPLGVEDQLINSVYPNPVQSIVHVDAKEFVNGQLLDLNGKTIQVANGRTIQFDLTGLKSGMYFVRVDKAGAIQTYKILKTN